MLGFEKKFSTDTTQICIHLLRLDWIRLRQADPKFVCILDAFQSKVHLSASFSLLQNFYTETSLHKLASRVDDGEGMISLWNCNKNICGNNFLHFLGV